MRVSAPLDELYFEWLYKKIGSTRNMNPAKSHWQLAELLYRREFRWYISNDDNRAQEGIELRYAFFEELSLEPDTEWASLACSVLEMLIALSERASFESDGEIEACSLGDWFWRITRNLQLDQYTDNMEFDASVLRDVNKKIDKLIARRYRRNGQGGMFPLKRVSEDQREVEIWYQLNAYLLELIHD